MEGFGLLIGHLLGDFILQNDFQATWKTGGPPPTDEENARILALHGDARGDAILDDEAYRSRKATLVCLLHCLLYTAAVWLCSFWWMPLWGLAVCFMLHFPIDRYRLAGRYMRNVSGQKQFATGIFSPWSIIVVDQVFHLVTLFVIGLIARPPF